MGGRNHSFEGISALLKPWSTLTKALSEESTVCRLVLTDQPLAPGAKAPASGPRSPAIAVARGAVAPGSPHQLADAARVVSAAEWNYECVATRQLDSPRRYPLP